MFKTKKYDEHGNEVRQAEPETEYEREEREANEARVAESKRRAAERDAAEAARIAKERAREEERRARFRPADGDRRIAAAIEARARAEAVVVEKQAALSAAEQAYIDEPDPAALAAANDARRKVEDAQHALELTRGHAAKVQGEVDGAERAAVVAEASRLEANRIEIIDDECRELAVEIGMLSSRLFDRVIARKGARFAELDEINALRARTGQPRIESTGNQADSADLSIESLVELAWAAQDGGTFEVGGGFFANPQAMIGFVFRTSITDVVRRRGTEAKELAKRVTARREKSVSSGVVKVVAGLGLGALAAIGLGAG